MFYTVSVAFPHLGIYIENLGRSVTVFGFEIAYYGIIIALGITAGYCTAQFQAKRTGQDPDIYLDFAMYVIIAAIVGARLYYVIFSWDDYKDSPMQILNLRAGGLAIYGAVLTSISMVFIYGKLKKYSPLLIGDTGAAGLVIGQAIGRWGNFFNSEAYGGPTNLPWKLYIAPQYRVIPYQNYEYFHPAFLYESVLDLIIFVILLIFAKKQILKKDGQLALIYLILYSFARIAVELCRLDSVRYVYGIPVAIIASLSIIVISSILLTINFKGIEKE